ncbi:MAG: glycosyltransferase family 2 protein, partial [Candidatus Zixiibacteriota bacterium]
VHTIEWQGFGAAKQAGLERAKGEWVLSIDADEEVTPALREEIRQAVNGNGNLAGYTIPRRTSFLGRWIRHCGWYPDPVLRLFRRSRGRFDDALVHERVVVDGPTARLSGELLHYSYPSLESYFEKFNRYTTLGAEEAFARGERARWYHFIGKPLMCFIKHYVLKKGFLDGIEGMVISVLSSCSVFVKYAKLRDLQRRARERTT